MEIIASIIYLLQFSSSIYIYLLKQQISCKYSCIVYTRAMSVVKEEQSIIIGSAAGSGEEGLETDRDDCLTALRIYQN